MKFGKFGPFGPKCRLVILSRFRKIGPAAGSANLGLTALTFKSVKTHRHETNQP